MNILYKNNNQVSSFEYLKQLCLFGLNRRLNNKLNDFSSICGVNFEISKLTLEEDERIISIKDEINLKRYLINHIKGE